MAGFFDKFKELIRIDDDYDDEYYDEYNDEDYYDEYYDDPVDEQGHDDYEEHHHSFSSSNISSFEKAKNEQYSRGDKVKITIHEPLNYNDAPKVLDDILRMEVAILNLEMLEIDKKKQIFDFVSGGIYALDAKMQKVTKDIFVIAPDGIEIDGKIKDQIQSKGFYQL